MNYYVSLLTIIFLFSCKGNQNNSNFNLSNPETVEFMGEGEYEKSQNPSNSYQLITNKLTPTGPVRFVVVDKKGNAIIKKALRDGIVTWHNDNQIRVEEFLGVASNDDNGKNIYFLDVPSELKP